MVVGGGRTGAAAARLLRREGAVVTVVDDGEKDVVVAGLAKYGVVENDVVVVAGGIDAAVVSGADVVVLSPGVPRSHPALREAIARDVVVNELELGLAVLSDNGRLLDGLRLWAITGTNGKSTTTTMAGAIARRVDKDAFVGGNLGLPLCQAVVDGLVAGSVSAPRILVVELSSYQLETLRFFPATAAAVTNLSPDHLDRYPDVDAYYEAKARLLSLCVGEVSLNAADTESARVLVPLVSDGLGFHFDISKDVDIGIGIDGDGAHLHLTVKRAGAPAVGIDVDNAAIVGHHNRQNAAAAAALAIADGFDDAVAAGLADYAGIAHRLERVGEFAGVTWWNDSKATNVDAAVIAVKSFAGGVHLIAGGTGKGSSYAPLVDVAVGRVVAVYTIGADAPAVSGAFAARFAPEQIVDTKTLAAACTAAAAAARPGEHIVLSPACASFDQFRDYTHRGAAFREAFDATVRQRSAP